MTVFKAFDIGRLVFKKYENNIDKKGSYFFKCRPWLNISNSFYIYPISRPKGL